MFTKLKLLFGILLFLLIGSLFFKPALAAAYTISGIVKDDNGNILPQTQMNLGSNFGSSNTTTDSNGYYQFVVNNDGYYTITATP